MDVFMKEVGFCILLQVLKHLVGLLEALFRFGFKELKIKTPNRFSVPLNGEGMTLAGWKTGNLGKPSPTMNV